MRRYLEILLVIVLLTLVLHERRVRAQTGNVVYFAPDTTSGTTVTNCGTPTTGFPLCGVATGWFVWSGTAWVQIGTAGTAVTSVSVCNATGSTCGAAQTGAVKVNVPTVAATTSTTTLQ